MVLGGLSEVRQKFPQTRSQIGKNKKCLTNSSFHGNGYHPLGNHWTIRLGMKKPILGVFRMSYLMTKPTKKTIILVFNDRIGDIKILVSKHTLAFENLVIFCI